MNIGLRLVKIAALYMVLGLVMGLVMAMSGDFSLASVHSHIALLGWAAMSITGVVYLLLPACSQSRLSVVHFWGHNIGLPVMMASLALYTYGHKDAEKVIGVGSMLVLASLVIFAINLYRNGKPSLTK